MWRLVSFQQLTMAFLSMYIASYECVDETESSAVSSVYWSSPGSILRNTSRDRQIRDWWSWAPGLGWWGYWEIRLCSGNPVPRPKSGRCRDASSVDAQPSQHWDHSTVISAVSSIPFPWVSELTNQTTGATMTCSTAPNLLWIWNPWSITNTQWLLTTLPGIKVHSPSTSTQAWCQSPTSWWTRPLPWPRPRWTRLQYPPRHLQVHTASLHPRKSTNNRLCPHRHHRQHRFHPRQRLKCLDLRLRWIACLVGLRRGLRFGWIRWWWSLILVILFRSLHLLKSESSSDFFWRLDSRIVAEQCLL